MPVEYCANFTLKCHGFGFVELSMKTFHIAVKLSKRSVAKRMKRVMECAKKISKNDKSQRERKGGRDTIKTKKYLTKSVNETNDKGKSCNFIKKAQGKI